MNPTVMARNILEAAGGKDNILHNAICMTRLRLYLKEDAKADRSRLKSIDGVLGIIEADSLQIVADSKIVLKLGTEFSELSGHELQILETDCGQGDIPHQITKAGEIFRKIVALFKRR